MRLLLLLLTLANLLYFSWSQGLLQDYGWAPHSDAEPQRLANQIRPQALRIVRPAMPTSAPTSLTAAPAPDPVAASLPRPVQCLQAGIFDEGQAVILRTALAAEWSAERWTLDPAVQPARWIIYLGPYASAAALAKKRAELAARKILPQALPDVALEPGLSLGSFDTQEAAQAELESLSQRGVKTARVLQSLRELRGVQLRLLVGAGASEEARLASLRRALAGKVLAPCV